MVFYEFFKIQLMFFLMSSGASIVIVPMNQFNGNNYMEDNPNMNNKMPLRHQDPTNLFAKLNEDSKLQQSVLIPTTINTNYDNFHDSQRLIPANFVLRSQDNDPYKLFNELDRLEKKNERPFPSDYSTFGHDEVGQKTLPNSDREDWEFFNANTKKNKPSYSEISHNNLFTQFEARSPNDNSMELPKEFPSNRFQKTLKVWKVKSAMNRNPYKTNVALQNENGNYEANRFHSKLSPTTNPHSVSNEPYSADNSNIRFNINNGKVNGNEGASQLNHFENLYKNNVNEDPSTNLKNDDFQMHENRFFAESNEALNFSKSNEGSIDMFNKRKYNHQMDANKVQDNLDPYKSEPFYLNDYDIYSKHKFNLDRADPNLPYGSQDYLYAQLNECGKSSDDSVDKSNKRKYSHNVDSNKENLDPYMSEPLYLNDYDFRSKHKFNLDRPGPNVPYGSQDYLNAQLNEYGKSVDEETVDKSNKRKYTQNLVSNKENLHQYISEPLYLSDYDIRSKHKFNSDRSNPNLPYGSQDYLNAQLNSKSYKSIDSSSKRLSGQNNEDIISDDPFIQSTRNSETSDDSVLESDYQNHKAELEYDVLGSSLESSVDQTSSYKKHKNVDFNPQNIYKEFVQVVEPKNSNQVVIAPTTSSSLNLVTEDKITDAQPNFHDMYKLNSSKHSMGVREFPHLKNHLHPAFMRNNGLDNSKSEMLIESEAQESEHGDNKVRLSMLQIKNASITAFEQKLDSLKQMLNTLRKYKDHIDTLVRDANDLEMELIEALDDELAIYKVARVNASKISSKTLFSDAPSKIKEKSGKESTGLHNSQSKVCSKENAEMEKDAVPQDQSEDKWVLNKNRLSQSQSQMGLNGKSKFVNKNEKGTENLNSNVREEFVEPEKDYNKAYQKIAKSQSESLQELKKMKVMLQEKADNVKGSKEFQKKKSKVSQKQASMNESFISFIDDNYKKESIEFDSDDKCHWSPRKLDAIT